MVQVVVVTGKQLAEELAAAVVQAGRLGLVEEVVGQRLLLELQ